MTTWALAAVYLLLAPTVAWGGWRVVRAGLCNLREAFALRHQPLLVGIENEQLEVLDGEPWPTRGRWPGPEHHREEFFDEKRRAVYRSVALDKALGLSLASELLLIFGAAYLGYALPSALQRLPSPPTAPDAATGAEAFFPSFAIAGHVIHTLGPTMWTFLVIAAALVMRGRSKRLRLASGYVQEPWAP